jgi:ribose transport system permease protein
VDRELRQDFWQGQRTRMLRLLRLREATILFIIIVTFCVLSILSPYFLTETNLRSVFIGISLDCMIAVGVTMGLVLRAMDISVGSVLGMCAALCGVLLKMGFHPLAASLVSIGAGGVAGCLNGLFITRLNINAIIVTLAMFNVARGMAYVITGGVPVTGFPKSFAVLGRGFLGPIPVPVFIMVIILAAFAFLMRWNVFFHQMYFVGSNPTAAALSGINVKRARFIALALSGILAGLAGVILASRLSSVQPDYGAGTEFRVITGALIGGVSLDGGRGTVLGAALGVLFMGLVNNALILLGVSVVWQKVVVGGLLLAAVVIDRLMSTEKARSL